MILNANHLFIVNPKAGKGRTLDIIPKIRDIFDGHYENCTIEITKYPGHATIIANEYTSKGNYRVYAVGGDGTLNEVLNGMAGSSSFLGVIPYGSGNDFIKNIYVKKIGDDIINDTINGNVQVMDLGKVQNRFFLNISSVGIDAEVVNNAIKLKKNPYISGALAYLFSVIITILKFKSKEIEINIDDKRIKINSTLLSVANGKYYGGGMKVAPKANLKDGYFDICLVSKLSKIKMLALFPKLINGTHDEIKEVSFYRGKIVNIVADEEMSLNIDGELIKSKRIDFSIIEQGINFIVPVMYRQGE